MTQRQVNAFLQASPQPDLDTANSIANMHVTIDTLLTTLVQKKRMVRREPSYNRIAPTDVSEMTSLVKTLRVPLQGLGLSRAMEENMRKAEKTLFEDPITECIPERRPRSYYGGTDEDEDLSTEDDEAGGLSSAMNSTANSSTSSLASELTTHSQNTATRRKRRKIRWEDSMKVMTYWRQDYDEILDIVKPTYLALTHACTAAILESVKRLRHMQEVDVRYENKPFFYKYYYRWKVGKTQAAKEKAQLAYSSTVDPSVQLLAAMQQFHQHRLVGLEKLYTKSGVPRRILFLLLTFQFNLHSYAESVYTLSSLIYELDQVRTKKKFWWPHMTLSKWLFKSRNTVESVELDSPNAIVKSAQQGINLQRTLSRRATLQRQQEVDLEKQSPLYKLDTPHRGQAHSPKEHHHRHPYDHAERPKLTKRHTNITPQEYHDPDVAYPTTPTQRFFYAIYMFLVRHLYTTDAAFSLRAAMVVACLTIPAFLESSYGWYNDVRGQWAAVVALIWMGPSVGSNFFG